MGVVCFVYMHAGLRTDHGANTIQITVHAVEFWELGVATV